LGLLLAILGAFPLQALGRSADGQLGTLVLPNNGRPACVLAGDTIEVLLHGDEHLLQLESGGESYPLRVEARGREAQYLRLSCTVPKDLAPGIYALRAGEDRNPASVFVYAEMPETYTLATLPLRADDDLPDASVLTEAHAAGAALLAIVGVDAAAAALVSPLDAAPLPVVLIPHANAVRAFERVFGPANGGFRFGPDGYLCFVSADVAQVDTIDAGDATLERWQRTLRPSRWRIGLGDRVVSLMGMRRQFVLFVDNPLDYCLVAEATDVGVGAPVFRSAWGRTTIGVPVLGGEGLTFIQVDASGLRPIVAEPLTSIAQP
jgi:hypothetical protein